MKKHHEDYFVGGISRLIEIFIGAGRKGEAEKIRDQALAVLDDARLESVVKDAEKRIQQRRASDRTNKPVSENLSSSSAENKLVIAVEQFDVAHPEPGGQYWGFKGFVPPDHLASFLFVLWTNGVPTIEPGFSTYFKVSKAGGIDLPFCSLSCYRIVGSSEFVEFSKRTKGLRELMAGYNYPESAGLSNAVRWNVNLGTGVTAGKWIAMPPYKPFEIKFPQSVRSGHQRIIRLVEFEGLEDNGSGNQSGVELRIFLEPLESPPIRTAPNEVDRINYISGRGLARTMEETLQLMNNLPIEL